MSRTSLLALALLVVQLVPGDLVDSVTADEAPEQPSPQFDPPVRLKAGEGFIDTGKYNGHAGPLVTDLDADGKPDLIVGNFNGSFQVYKNVGTRTEPEYEDQGLLKADGATVEIPNW